jgi:nucleotide-binding universal stress UspA family protein
MPGDLARILVPTDFSPSSDGAVAFAKKLAHTFGASLHVVHVLEDRPVREVAAAQKLVDAQLTAGERVTIQAATVLLRGPVATTIANYAATHAIDLVVMATGGHGARGVLGQVVNQVARLGPCPVLTVKDEQADARPSDAVGHSASTFV